VISFFFPSIPYRTWHINKEGGGMMNEQHLLSPGELLGKDGNLAECGYAYSLVKTYSRKAIKARKGRIKEWDYYYVGNTERGIALTIDDNGYMDLCSASVLDFRKKAVVEKMIVHPFSYGKRALPSSSSVGDTVYEDKKVTMRFTHEGNKRHLYCVWPHFDKAGHELRVDLFPRRDNGRQHDGDCHSFPKETSFLLQPERSITSTAAAMPNSAMISWISTRIRMASSIGAAGFGVIRTFGIGLRSTRFRMAIRSAGIWAMALAIPPPPAKTCFSYDQDVYKLNDVKFDIPMDEKAHDDYLKPWKFRSSRWGH
jgi:hypothetical protein